MKYIKLFENYSSSEEDDGDNDGSGSEDDSAAAREGEAHTADDALGMAEGRPGAISMREFDDSACCG